MTSTDSSDGATAEPFERQLGRFLLVAYASGDDVEGEWHLLDTDPMVPDVTVIVTPIDSGPASPSSSEEATFTPNGPTDFKSRFQTFVLERFANNDDIEGTWVVRYARESLPDWEVSISTSADAEFPGADDEIVHLE